MRSYSVILSLVVATYALAADPQRWEPGPYLLLDDSLVAGQSGLQREVGSPSRLPDPVVTGYEDGCFQPYMTVLRDPQTRRFRMWYGVPATPQNASESRLAYMESDDGIHWLRPPRLLDTPPIQFGASVLDEGPHFPDRAKRFKFAWWKDGGLRIATSPDGFAWTSVSPEPVVRANHDITGIDWDPIRKRYVALLSIYADDGPYRHLRIPHQSVSDDLLEWRAIWPIVTPDPNAEIEKGETQFYGMSAVLPRGRLLVSLVKVLRDDLNCEPGKTAKELRDASRPFAGIGYTVVAWSRDGEHWRREKQPFLDRNDRPGTWDRAMAWADDQMIVGDHTYIYYGGYRWGHKAERFTDRQIGFAHMPRDRYAGYTAGEAEGTLRTVPAIVEHPLALSVNARVDPGRGELKVRVVDDAGRALPGHDWQNCQAIRGDRTDHPVIWDNTHTISRGAPIRFEFHLKYGTIYSFELK